MQRNSIYPLLIFPQLQNCNIIQPRYWHWYCQDIEHFHHHRILMLLVFSDTLFLSRLPLSYSYTKAITNPLSIYLSLYLSIYHLSIYHLYLISRMIYKWNHLACNILGFLFGFSLILWRCVQVVLYTTATLLFIIECFVIWKYQSLYNHSPIEGHLGCA